MNKKKKKYYLIWIEVTTIIVKCLLKMQYLTHFHIGFKNIKTID